LVLDSGVVCCCGLYEVSNANEWY